MNASRLLPTLTAFVVAASLVFGCHSIVGIEDRTYDPTLGASGSGDQGGATASGGASASGGANASGGSGGPMTPCQEYCTLAMENCPNRCAPLDPCPDDLSLYTSIGSCLKVCETFETGDLDEEDPSGDTLACRLHQVRVAGTLQTDKVEHCAYAGPGGSGVCGDDCESYCSLMNEFCAEDFGEFVDDDCVANCRGISLEKRTDATATLFGTVRHHDGDTLQCRLMHASSASVAPKTHCWHAALVPQALTTAGGEEPNPCADPKDQAPTCEVYCRLIQVSCQGELAAYASEAQCRAVCNALPEAADNNVTCRRTHAYNAMAFGGIPHCSHAGPGGTGPDGANVCGSNCVSYCALLEQACADDFTDSETCIEECSKVPGADEGFTLGSADDGDNFGCRMRAVMQALNREPEECESAIGGGVCRD